MISVSHLTKKYGTHTAVSDLSFEIEDGQIYGFLGPNGAGKSTTMNIMTGCLAATEGEVSINGCDIFEQPQAAKKQIGYLPEQPPLYLDRTPREYLTFVARAKGVPEKEIKSEIERVMNITDITEKADRLCKNLSKGYKQRVGIAQALLGDPQIIILDEPTVGLDPMQIIEIRELITGLGKDHTVILSSHILSEVQAVCSTVLIIANGKLVACDTPENLEKLFAGEAVIEITADTDAANAESILAGIENIAVESAQEKDGRSELKLNVTGEKDIDEASRAVFFAFAGAGCAILSMSASKASLEEVFIELTRAENESAAPAEATPAEEAPAEAPEETQEVSES